MNKLIIFEGIVGSGKSTASKWLKTQLCATGRNAIYYPEAVPTNSVHEYLIGKKRAATFPKPGCNWKEHQWNGIEESMMNVRIEKAHAFVREYIDSNQISVFDGGLFHRDVDGLVMLGLSFKSIFEHLLEFTAIIKKLNPILIYFHNQNTYDSLKQIHHDRGDFWHKGETSYFVDSPYGKKNHLRDFKGYVSLYKKLKEFHIEVIKSLKLSAVVIDNSSREWNKFYKKIEPIIFNGHCQI